MSENLKDLRCKITPLSDCYLEAEAQARGLDKSALARTILDEWARGRHAAFIRAQRLLKAEGISVVAEGSSGYGRDTPASDDPERDAYVAHLEAIKGLRP